MKRLSCILLSMSVSFGTLSAQENTTVAFPFDMPEQKPDRPLSAAMQRNYDNYLGTRPEHNELYSQFKYTKLKGFDYNNGDGTISRRDPSKVIFENGRYYVWYTKRNTEVAPIGMRNAKQADDKTPTADWDLSDIFYATSTDGFTWQEQGVAVPRPPKPQIGWRSVTTTDILKFKGRYYLYYQGFSETIGLRGDYCPVAVSYADSPDGPWTPANKVIIPNGVEGEWDQNTVHDPYPLVHNGKIYLYYKADFGRFRDIPRKKNLVRMQGLATADNPLGPFTKHPLNPLINSGHETTLFPFKEGIAALVIRDGNESNTIQYAADWVNFKVAAHSELLPNAGGPYIPDAFTDTKYGRGITWGISHFTNVNGPKTNHSMITRFDVDLSLDVDDPQMKRHGIKNTPEYHWKQGLSSIQKKRIAAQNKKVAGK